MMRLRTLKEPALHYRMADVDLCNAVPSRCVIGGTYAQPRDLHHPRR